MNYSLEQAANKLNLSSRTLRRYDRDGIFIALRHPTGRFYYTSEMLDDYVTGTYNPKEQSKYKTANTKPIEIRLNLSKMTKLESISEDNVSYYKFTESDDYTSLGGYDVVEVNQMRNNGYTRYTIGKIIERDGQKLFDACFYFDEAII